MEAERLQLNLDDVSLGDIEDFEDYTGMSFAVLDQVKDPEKAASMSAKVFTGMALLALRHENPDATIEEARKVKVSQLMGAVDDDPTVAEPTKLEPLNSGKGRQGKRTSA